MTASYAILMWTEMWTCRKVLCFCRSTVELRGLEPLQVIEKQQVNP
jgi:hypothetical protein